MRYGGCWSEGDGWIRELRVRADGLAAYVRSGSAKSSFAAAASWGRSRRVASYGGRGEAAEKSGSFAVLSRRGGGWATMFEGSSSPEGVICRCCVLFRLAVVDVRGEIRIVLYSTPPCC